MLSIFYTIFDARLSNEEFSSLLSTLPQNDQNRIQQFKRWQDRQIHLAGRLLLFKGLVDLGYSTSILDSVRITPYGKPFINADIEFSLSNSGMCAACAITDSDPIGIDVETMRDIDISDFKSIMSLDEWSEIQNSKNQLKAFYSFWTKKEAVLKADGRGFSVPSEQIRIEKHSAIIYDERWHITNISLKAPYICHLATSNPVDAVYIHEISPDSLGSIVNFEVTKSPSYSEGFQYPETLQVL